MNSDVMHTTIYAAEPLSVSVLFVDLQAILSVRE